MKIVKNWRGKLSYKTQLNIKDVKKRNKKFHSLKIADRRREIALDVISMVELDLIHSATHDYWTIPLMKVESRSETAEELQNNFLDIDSTMDCKVCARGAMMLSTIRLGNRLKPNHHRNLDNGDDNTQTHFPFGMYLIMENQFETSNTSEGDLYDHNTDENLLNIFIQVVETGKFRRDRETDYLKLIIR